MYWMARGEHSRRPWLISPQMPRVTPVEQGARLDVNKERLTLPQFAPTPLGAPAPILHSSDWSEQAALNTATALAACRERLRPVGR